MLAQVGGHEGRSSKSNARCSIAAHPCKSARMGTHDSGTDGKTWATKETYTYDLVGNRRSDKRTQSSARS